MRQSTSCGACGACAGGGRDEFTPSPFTSLVSSLAAALLESAAVRMAVRTPSAAMELVVERKELRDLGVKDHRRYCVEVR